MIILFEKKQKLVEMLTLALRQCVARITNEFSKHSVYAFVVYPSSGFRDMGLAFSTREDISIEDQTPPEIDDDLKVLLADHPDLLEKAKLSSTPPKYLVASEWKYASYYQHEFNSINELISSNYDDLYEAGVSGNQISQFFQDVVIESMKYLQSEAVLSSPPFEVDIFWGIQFPGEFAGDISVNASKALNSEYWHREFLKYV